MKTSQFLLSLTAVGLMCLPLSTDYWNKSVFNPKRTIAADEVQAELTPSEKLNQDLSKANEQIQVLTNQLEQAQKTALLDDEECDKQQKVVDGIQVKIDQQKLKIEELEAKIQKAEADKLCDKEDIEMLQKMLAESKKELEDTCETMDILTAEILKTKEALKEREEVLAKKEQELEEKQAELKEQKELHDTYVCSSDEKIAKLTTQVEQFVKDQNPYLQMMMNMNQMMMMMMWNSFNNNNSALMASNSFNHAYNTTPLVLGERGYSQFDSIPNLFGSSLSNLYNGQPNNSVINNYYGAGSPQGFQMYNPNQQFGYNFSAPLMDPSMSAQFGNFSSSI